MIAEVLRRILGGRGVLAWVGEMSEDDMARRIPGRSLFRGGGFLCALVGG